MLLKAYLPERPHVPPRLSSVLAYGAFKKTMRNAPIVGSDQFVEELILTVRGQHVKYPPYAFTEHGAIMAAMVLSSPQAVFMSVYVVRAFSQMRERLVANAAILKRLAEIDGTLLRHDAALRDIYRKLLPLLQPPPDPPKRRIGFHVSDE